LPKLREITIGVKRPYQFSSIDDFIKYAKTIYQVGDIVKHPDEGRPFTIEKIVQYGIGSSISGRGVAGNMIYGFLDETWAEIIKFNYEK
jgi:hypothetical protein